MQDYKLLNQICSFRQNVTPFLKRDTSTRCDVRIEPSDLQFQGSTNLISHQPNDLDWALCRPGQAGLGHNRRSEWGGHIFKGKMNIIKMITATDYGRPVRKSPSLHGRKSTPTPKFLVRPKHILSATSAQIFRFLWFMPLLGVRSPWSQPSIATLPPRHSVLNWS